MSKNYRIIQNSSGTRFKIQEKTYSWKNIIMNLLLTCLQGEGMFKEQHQWETVFCHFSFESIVREVERLEQLEKDQYPSTWSVVDYDS